MWLLNVFENVYDCCCCSNHVLVSVLWVGLPCCWYVGRAEILTILLSDHFAIWFSLTWIVSREKFSVLMKMCFCWWSLQETVCYCSCHDSGFLIWGYCFVLFLLQLAVTVPFCLFMNHIILGIRLSCNFCKYRKFLILLWGMHVYLADMLQLLSIL
jgi:hypothetical protein